MKKELVEILGGVQFEMAGQAVAALQAAGIAVEVRTPGIDPPKVEGPRGFYSSTYLYVAPGDAASFEDEAAATAPADDSVRDFLKS